MVFISGCGEEITLLRGLIVYQAWRREFSRFLQPLKIIYNPDVA